MGDSTPLMVTRKDQRTLRFHNPKLVRKLRLFLESEIVEQPQPGILISEFLPEKGHRIRVCLCRFGIPCVTVATLIERQESRFLAVELRGHLNIRFADGEMDDSSAFRLEQGTFCRSCAGFRLAVLLVFLDGFVDILREIRFNLSSCHGDAVNEENKVNRLPTVVRSEMNLLHHAQDVLAVAGLNIFVALVLRLAFAHAKCAEANQRRIVTQKPQRPLVTESGHQVVKDSFGAGSAVIGGEALKLVLISTF